MVNKKEIRYEKVVKYYEDDNYLQTMFFMVIVAMIGTKLINSWMWVIFQIFFISLFAFTIRMITRKVYWRKIK